MKFTYCILIFNLMLISVFAQPKTKEVSHYIFPEFTQGVVLMKSGVTQKALLNYNSLTEEMVYIDKGVKLAISDETLAKIDTVFIRDKKFVVVGTKFFELIVHSKFDLYIEHKCDLRNLGKPTAYGATSQTTSVSSYSSIPSQSMKYELKLSDEYGVEPYIYYWIKKNNASKKFSNMRQLKNLYASKKDLMDVYVKDHDVKYDDQKTIVQLIEYLESH